MLTGNLATRPFYNERLVRGVLIVALAAAVAWAAVNATTLISLSQQSAMLSERVARRGPARGRGPRRGRGGAPRSRRGRAEARGPGGHRGEQLIQQRTFSWTELFNQFEQTLPPDVRLVQVQPQIDDDGRLMVALTVISRRIEDLDTFIGRLEATGAFSGVLSRSDETLDDGTIESNLQGYYQHAANPAPASSEPESAGATGVRAEGGR